MRRSRLPLFLLFVALWLAGPGGCGGGTDWQEEYQEGEPLIGPDGKADGFGPDVPAYAPLPPGADLSAPLQVIFAPGEPVVTLELYWIDWVRQQRASDGNSYPEGENPYFIHYAVYTMRNQRIIEALADAEAEGVDVQILIESDQLGKERTWMTVDEYLSGRGFEVVLDHHDLDERSRATADLIGIKHYGLMHLKTRIFHTPTDCLVLSGSFNPGSYAPLNDENFHLIRDSFLVERYRDMYRHLLYGERPVNVWDDTRPVNVLFTRPREGIRPGEMFLRWLGEEQEQILIMTYSLRDITAPGEQRSLVQLLAEKVAAGIPVYVISDRKQSDGGDHDDTDDRLRAAGVPVYEARNYATTYSAMHHKVAVLGRSHIRVVADSANWTKSGLGTASNIARNTESMLFIDTQALDDGRTGRRYLAEWLKVLERYAEQGQAIDGEQSYQEVEQRLLVQPDWPEQAVGFLARRAETDMGEVVYVLGDYPRLGGWGELGPGVELVTDPQDYPDWWTNEPVLLPLALQFEWKLTALDAGAGRRWEDGPNRLSRAWSPALQADETYWLQAVWR